MPKLKDWLKDVATKGKIQDSNFETVLAASALAEIEVPDTFVTLFNNSFLTKDRAINDPDIVAQLAKASNKTAFDTFDQKINGFLAFVDPEDQEKIKGTRETYEKYDILRGALEKVKKSASGKVNEDANKILEEKTREIKALRDAHAKELSELTQKLNDEFVDGQLRAKVLAYNFADAFKPMKDQIANLKVSQVRQRYVPISDKGELKLMTKTSDGQLVEAYDGNEKLTIEKFLEKDMADFIAKSNAAPKDQSQQRTAIPDPIDASKETLAQKRLRLSSLPN